MQKLGENFNQIRIKLRRRKVSVAGHHVCRRTHNFMIIKTIINVIVIVIVIIIVIELHRKVSAAGHHVCRRARKCCRDRIQCRGCSGENHVLHIFNFVFLIF